MVITASITLVGEGASETVIEGGGPVITIGEFDAPTQPTVVVEGVTIAGGVTRSTVEADRAGLPGAEARGGGISIPPSIDGGPGATVTLRDVVVSKNRVATTSFEEFSDGAGSTASSLSAGGGIDNWGDLTIERSSVIDNLVGAATGLSAPGNSSDAFGGGIMQNKGVLVIVDSEISRNVATVRSPNGRFAEGGGLFVEAGSLTITDSVIANNRVRVDSTFPKGVDSQAQPGGILIHGGVSEATISNTEIVDNRAEMTTTNGLADAGAGGLNSVPGAALVIEGSTISRNSVTATATGSGDAVAAIGGAAGMGTVTDTIFEGNTVVATAARGDASAGVGGMVILGTTTESTIRANELRARAPMGTVIVFGAGAWVAERALTLENTVAEDNVATATGFDGWVRGGGIYAGPTPGGVGPSPLTLVASTISNNRLESATPVATRGGGLYVEGTTLTMQESVLANNTPDNCRGCRR